MKNPEEVNNFIEGSGEPLGDRKIKQSQGQGQGQGQIQGQVVKKKAPAPPKDLSHISSIETGSGISYDEDVEERNESYLTPPNNISNDNSNIDKESKVDQSNKNIKNNQNMKKGSSMKKGLLDGAMGKIILMIFPIIVSFAIIQMTTVPFETYKKDFTGLQLDVLGVHKTIDGHTGTINDMNAKVATATNSINSAKDGLQSAVTSSVQNSVNSAINTAMTGYVKNKDYTDLYNQVQTLDKANKAKDDTIKKLQDDLKAHASATTTTTTGTTGTTTGTTTTGTTTGTTTSGSSYNNVSASVSGLYSFNGLPLLSYSVINPTGGEFTGVSSWNFAGSGFVVGDIVILTAQSGGQGTGVNLTVSAIGATGNITQVTVNSAGTGYVNGNIYSVSLATVRAGVSSASIVISANAISANSSSQSFVVNLVNNEKTVAQNVQLAIGLGYVDANGVPVNVLPSWITPGTSLTVTSNNFGSNWTYQSLVNSNIWVFTNTSNNSMFQMGSISLNPGTTQVYLYANVRNSTFGVSQNVYLYPMVKVVGYSVQ